MTRANGNVGTNQRQRRYQRQKLANTTAEAWHHPEARLRENRDQRRFRRRRERREGKRIQWDDEN